MSKTMLKTLRILAPGVIVLVCMLPYFKLTQIKRISEAVSGNVLISAVTLVAVVVGGVYYALDVRSLLWRPFVQKCHENVRKNIVSPYLSDTALRGIVYRATDKKAMRIFYHVIDNDPSLSDQAHDVRLNGAILTTIIDAILLFIFFAVIYCITYLLIQLYFFKWLTIVVLLLQPVLWFFKTRVSSKHLQLENEQLEVIQQLHSETVRNQLLKLL